MSENEPKSEPSEKTEQKTERRSTGDDQTELYGPNFALLVDPEPSILSLFKFQMSRVQERSQSFVNLLKQAERLHNAEQAAAECLGFLGTHYSQ